MKLVAAVLISPFLAVELVILTCGPVSVWFALRDAFAAHGETGKTVLGLAIAGLLVLLFFDWVGSRETTLLWRSCCRRSSKKSVYSFFRHVLCAGPEAQEPEVVGEVGSAQDSRKELLANIRTCFILAAYVSSVLVIVVLGSMMFLAGEPRTSSSERNLVKILYLIFLFHVAGPAWTCWSSWKLAASSRAETTRYFNLFQSFD